MAVQVQRTALNGQRHADLQIGGKGLGLVVQYQGHALGVAVDNGQSLSQDIAVILVRAGVILHHDVLILGKEGSHQVNVEGCLGSAGEHLSAPGDVQDLINIFNAVFAVGVGLESGQGAGVTVDLGVAEAASGSVQQIAEGAHQRRSLRIQRDGQTQLIGLCLEDGLSGQPLQGSEELLTGHLFHGGLQSVLAIAVQYILDARHQLRAQCAILRQAVGHDHSREDHIVYIVLGVDGGLHCGRALGADIYIAAVAGNQDLLQLHHGAFIHGQGVTQHGEDALDAVDGAGVLLALVQVHAQIHHIGLAVVGADTDVIAVGHLCLQAEAGSGDSVGRQVFLILNSTVDAIEVRELADDVVSQGVDAIQLQAAYQEVSGGSHGGGIHHVGKVVKLQVIQHYILSANVHRHLLGGVAVAHDHLGYSLGSQGQHIAAGLCHVSPQGGIGHQGYGDVLTVLAGRAGHGVELLGQGGAVGGIAGIVQAALGNVAVDNDHAIVLTADDLAQLVAVKVNDDIAAALVYGDLLAGIIHQDNGGVALGHSEGGIRRGRDKLHQAAGTLLCVHNHSRIILGMGKLQAHPAVKGLAGQALGHHIGQVLVADLAQQVGHVKGHLGGQIGCIAGSIGESAIPQDRLGDAEESLILGHIILGDAQLSQGILEGGGRGAIVLHHRLDEAVIQRGNDFGQIPGILRHIIYICAVKDQSGAHECLVEQVGVHTDIDAAVIQGGVDALILQGLDIAAGLLQSGSALVKVLHGHHQGDRGAVKLGVNAQQLAADGIQSIHIAAVHCAAALVVDCPQQLATLDVALHDVAIGIDNTENGVHTHAAVQDRIHQGLQIEPALVGEVLVVLAHLDRAVIEQLLSHALHGGLGLHSGAGCQADHQSQLAVHLIGDHRYTQAALLAADIGGHAVAGGESLVHSRHGSHKLLPVRIHLRAHDGAGAICEQGVEGHVAGGIHIKCILAMGGSDDLAANGVIIAEAGLVAGGQRDGGIVISELDLLHGIPALVHDVHGVGLGGVDRHHGQVALQLCFLGGNISRSLDHIVGQVHIGQKVIHSSIDGSPLLSIDGHILLALVVAEGLGCLILSFLCAVAVLHDHIDGDALLADTGGFEHSGQHRSLGDGSVFLHALGVGDQRSGQLCQICIGCSGIDSLIGGHQVINGFLEGAADLIDLAVVLAHALRIQHILQAGVILDDVQIPIQVCQLRADSLGILIIVCQTGRTIQALVGGHIAKQNQAVIVVAVAAVCQHIFGGILGLLRHLPRLVTADEVRNGQRFAAHLLQVAVLVSQLIQSLDLALGILCQVIGQIQDVGGFLRAQAQSLPSQLQGILHLHGVEALSDVGQIGPILLLCEGHRSLIRTVHHGDGGGRDPQHIAGAGLEGLSLHRVAAFSGAHSQQRIIVGGSTQPHIAGQQCALAQDGVGGGIIGSVVLADELAQVMLPPSLARLAGNSGIAHHAHLSALVIGLAIHGVVPNQVLIRMGRQSQSVAIGRTLYGNIITAVRCNGKGFRGIRNGICIGRSIHQAGGPDSRGNRHSAGVIGLIHAIGRPAVQDAALEAVGGNSVSNGALAGLGSQTHRGAVAGVGGNGSGLRSTDRDHIGLHHHIHGGLGHVGRHRGGVSQQFFLGSGGTAEGGDGIQLAVQCSTVCAILHQAFHHEPVKLRTGLQVSDHTGQHIGNSRAQSTLIGIGIHFANGSLRQLSLAVSLLQSGSNRCVVRAQTHRIGSQAAGTPHLAHIHAVLSIVGQLLQLIADPFLIPRCIPADINGVSAFHHGEALAGPFFVVHHVQSVKYRPNRVFRQDHTLFFVFHSALGAERDLRLQNLIQLICAVLRRSGGRLRLLQILGRHQQHILLSLLHGDVHLILYSHTVGGSVEAEAAGVASVLPLGQVKGRTVSLVVHHQLGRHRLPGVPIVGIRLGRNGLVFGVNTHQIAAVICIRRRIGVACLGQKPRLQQVLFRAGQAVVVIRQQLTQGFRRRFCCSRFRPGEGHRGQRHNNGQQHRHAPFECCLHFHTFLFWCTTIPLLSKCAPAGLRSSSSVCPQLHILLL